ncbi:MAG TPA: hypothetical protein VMS92_04330 [Mycobacterium sp.]|nr:hypothetical protein [Mycobacterium sp.]
MNTKNIVAGGIAGIAAVVAPALLFLGGGTAQAAQPAQDVISEHGGATITQRPGHIAIYAEPQEVSPPLVWGPFSSVVPILEH